MKLNNQNPLRGLVMMICLLVLVFVAFGFFRQTTAHSSHSYAELRDLILSEQVEEVVCDEDSVTLLLKKPMDTGETQVLPGLQPGPPGAEGRRGAEGLRLP